MSDSLLSCQTASILVIGNEILSGQTQDTQVSYLAKRLETFGIQLKEVRIVEDYPHAIASHLNELRLCYDNVFTTGGIGGTHDDVTAQSVALAFQVPLVKDPCIEAVLHHHYGDPLLPSYERMCYVPEGAGLIPNSISFVPGFYLKNVFCLAGFPEIAASMFEEISKNLTKGSSIYTQSLTCEGLLEADIATSLEEIQNAYPSVQLGSYPFYGQNCGVMLVAKGRIFDDVQETIKKLRKILPI